LYHITGHLLEPGLSTAPAISTFRQASAVCRVLL
jgi:hypothetical protein